MRTVTHTWWGVGVPEGKFVPVCTDASAACGPSHFPSVHVPVRCTNLRFGCCSPPADALVEWHARCAALVALCGLVPAPVGLSDFIEK